jgi:hypothetical protein
MGSSVAAEAYFESLSRFCARQISAKLAKKHESNSAAKCRTYTVDRALKNALVRPKPVGESIGKLDRSRYQRNE